MGANEEKGGKRRATPKKKAERFVEQQYALYGDIIGTRTKGAAKKKEMEEASDQLFEMEGPDAWFKRELSRIDEEWVRAASLDEFERMIADCRKCPLWETRTKLVFGTGSPQAGIMVIGEAPGADEDQQGKPFVGAAGRLLTKILEAINLTRDEVYICNILKSRPPGNRRPESIEVAACIPYLYKQIDLIRPKVILALGLTAAKALLGKDEPMKTLRGTLQDWHGIPMLVTYHPAALLRNPQWKRATWEDVQMLRRIYDESVKAGS